MDQAALTTKNFRARVQTAWQSLHKGLAVVILLQFAIIYLLAAPEPSEASTSFDLMVLQENANTAATRAGEAADSSSDAKHVAEEARVAAQEAAEAARSADSQLGTLSSSIRNMALFGVRCS